MNDSSLQNRALPLPEEFPQGVSQPKFQIGDRVQWQPHPTQDFGTITGFIYAPAPHLQTWAWKYVVWLDAGSPSHPWTATDTAWESDLELASRTVEPRTEQGNCS